MKILWMNLAWLFALMGLSCSVESSTAQKDADSLVKLEVGEELSIPSPKSEQSDSNGKLGEQHPEKKIKLFTVDAHGETFTAKSDDSGKITITDYPAEWRGKVRLIRADFEIPDLEPFSQEHCDRLAGMAQNGLKAFVRSAFHSLLVFEMPPFLATDFVGIIRNSAKVAGINWPITSIENLVDKIHGRLELDISNDAISILSGNFSEITEQFNLSGRGGFADDRHKEMLVVSGDIICDLIFGKAKIKMIYSIISEDKTIDIIYDQLTLDL